MVERQCRSTNEAMPLYEIHLVCNCVVKWCGKATFCTSGSPWGRSKRACTENVRREYFTWEHYDTPK